MRAFTAAALQIAPVPEPLSRETVKADIDKCVDWLTRCVETTGAELVVLPESATTGFTPDCSPEELFDLVSGLPGPVIEPIQDAVAKLGVHVCVGSYERGEERGVVYNSSVLIGPTARGAEVICRPSALLRSADIWELTSRARAYDNHVYLIGANATGTDSAGVLYFGNSHIVTPIAHIAA